MSERINPGTPETMNGTQSTASVADQKQENAPGGQVNTEPTHETGEKGTTPPPLPKENVEDGTKGTDNSIGKGSSNGTSAASKQEDDTSNATSTDKMPDWARELISEVNALKEARSAEINDKRSADIEALIAPLGDTLKAIYRRTETAHLTSDQFDALKETIRTEVETLTREATTRGAVFERPTESGNRNGTSSNATDSELRAVFSRLNL